MERVSVEIWQQILLKVMETTDWPIFATSCTPYTFLGFTYLHVRHQRDRKPYLDYLAQRRCLRLVCRAWNEFVLFTSHRWLPLEGRSPKYKLDSTSTRAKGGVGPVEILSTKIYQKELVTPILSWVSHILKRPASQSPLRAYILDTDFALRPRYNPLDDLLVRTTTTQDPEYTNTNTTNTTLRLLALCGANISVSFSQISHTFAGLRSLFLINLDLAPKGTLALAHLELLWLDCRSPDLRESIETWDTPALRHVHLGRFSTPLTDVLDRFLGRYAHQIESLVLSHFHSYLSPCLDLPSKFWAQFAALRLLGLDYCTLVREEWSGWSVVPPPTHPCRYLVCPSSSVESRLNDIRARWTWHDDVRLVAGHPPTNQYHIVKNIRAGWSIEGTRGILPEL